jgi:hypothetical protein
MSASTSTCSRIKEWRWTSRSRASCVGKLRELRFHVGREHVRITYFIAPGRRIILLTVFRKTRQRERAEIDRAWRAMQTCITDHLGEKAE